tara:strand:- start:2783 stop:2908 length:126 start_codon:yes stop_codon:yes gene_type:complete
MKIMKKIINFLKRLFHVEKNKKDELSHNIKKARKNDPFIYD